MLCPFVGCLSMCSDDLVAVNSSLRYNSIESIVLVMYHTELMIATLVKLLDSRLNLLSLRLSCLRQYPQVFAHLKPDASKQAPVIDVLNELDELLTNQCFLAIPNHMTLADLSIIASLSLLELLDWQFAKWPQVEKWRRRLADLEYYASCNKGLEDWKYYLYLRQQQRNRHE